MREAVLPSAFDRQPALDESLRSAASEAMAVGQDQIAFVRLDLRRLEGPCFEAFQAGRDLGRLRLAGLRRGLQETQTAQELGGKSRQDAPRHRQILTRDGWSFRIPHHHANQELGPDQTHPNRRRDLLGKLAEPIDGFADLALAEEHVDEPTDASDHVGDQLLTEAAHTSCGTFERRFRAAAARRRRKRPLASAW